MKKILYLVICLLAGGQLSGQNIITIAGRGSYAFTGDGGQATAAEFETPWFVTMDAAGNIYFTDNANDRIRKIDASGIIHTLIGQGYAGSFGDGGAATNALISSPAGIVVDASGNIIFADAGNHKIRKIDVTGIITTIAGTGAAGYSGDGGQATAAKLNTPRGICLGLSGDLYFADYSTHCVRRISTSGIISTVAGTGFPGFSGDGGPAITATLTSPGAVAMDLWGNLYITDVLNQRIRKVNTGGFISTVAGTGVAGFSGDGGAATAAKLSTAVGIAIDMMGDVLISDQFNHRIRKIDALTGIINTVVGTGAPSFGGDGGAATAAQINKPYGISLDSVGNTYICDMANIRLRKVGNNAHNPFFTSGLSDSVVMCENDAPFDISSMLGVADADLGQQLTWTLFSAPLHGVASVSYTAATTGSAIMPSGLTYAPATGYSGADTFKVRVDDGYAMDTFTITVRVKPLPGLSPIAGPAVVCIGTPVTFADTASSGTWISSNGSATIDAAGNLNGVYLGVDTIYFTKTVDGCTSIESAVTDIYPISDSIAGPPVVCVRNSVVLTGIPAGGTWTEANGYATVSSSGLLTGVIIGIDTVTYTVTNPCGTSTFQKVMYINNVVGPSIIITGSPGAFIVAGTSDTLMANVIGGAGYGYTYQWEINGNDIPGATDSIYISDTLANHDSVTCIVTNGPCTASSFGWIMIVHVRAGVNNVNVSEAELSVVPNPAANTFTVSGTFPFEDEQATIEITNLLGQSIYRDEARITHGVLKKRITPDDRFADGAYLLQVITPYGRRVEQIVISR